LFNKKTYFGTTLTEEMFHSRMPSRAGRDARSVGNNSSGGSTSTVADTQATAGTIPTAGIQEKPTISFLQTLHK